MAAGNDTVNIKVKYIPDTSALKNIKEIRMPEIKVGGKDAGKGVFDSYNNAIRDLNRELSKGTDASAITKAFKTVGEETQKVRTQINSMKEAINQSFQSPSNQSLIKDYQGLEKQLRKLDTESQKRRKKSAELSSFKSQNKMSTPQARKEISKAEALVTAGEKLTKQDQERLEIARQIVAKEEELAKLRTQEEIRNAQKDIKNQMSDSKYDSMISSTEANRILGQYNDILSRVGINLNGVTGESRKFSSSLDEQVNQVKAAKKEVVKFGDIVSGTFLGTSLNNLFQTGLSRGIEFFKDYDETLTRTMMVTGQTREEVNGLTSSYNKLANQLSSTTKDVAAAQLVFYQQGLGTSEALKMTEASIAVSKTGGIDAAEAADRLTAAVRGYQLSANEAMDIADKMSALDAAAASSVDELTVAMQKSASQARMAGLDLNYYMAYLSTMQEVTREAPENIGTAMKSITSRLQEIKDIGKIEEDGTTFSNVAKALNSIGIAATDSSGQLRTLQEIMNELGPIWNTLDRNHKAYVATVLAGNRQQSRFIALMDNYDRAMELVNVSQNASGESAKQLRAYNQGLEASFTKLTNAWQQFATRLADSDMVKGVVDLLTSFIEVLNKIPKPITQTVIPLMALSKGFQLLKNAGSLFNEFKGAIGKKLGIDSFTKDAETMNSVLLNSTSLLGRWGNKIKDAFDGFGNRSKEIQKSTAAIKDNTESAELNSAALMSNDTQQLSETGASSKTTLAKDAEKKTTDALTASLEAQKTEMMSNDDAYYLETQQAYKKAEQNLIDAKKEHERNVNKLSSINVQAEDSKAEYHRKTSAASQAYKEAVQPENLRKQAIFNLKEQGVLSDNVQMSLFGDNTEKQIKRETERIRREIGQAYHEVVEANKLESQEASKQFKKQIEDAKTQLASSEGKISIAEEELANTRETLLRNRRNKNPDNGNNIPSNIKESFNAKKIKDILSNDTIGNIDKLKGSFEELSKVINISSVASGIMVGSLVNMGGQALGLDDDLSGAIGTFGGLGKTLSGFGPWGWAAAAGIAALQFGFKKLYPSVEDVQKKLTELSSEKDGITQKISDINTAKETYEDLGRKLNKTEEEQSQFNDAIEVLQKEVPGAVSGYDSMGNAIINLTKVTEELNRQQEELVANSKKTLKEFTNLQKAEGSNGWTIAGDVLSTIDYITNLPVKLAEDLSGQPITLSGWLQDTFIKPHELEARKKVWQENFSEIYSSMQSLVADVVDNGTAENQALRQKVSNSILNAFTVDGMAEGAKVEDVQKEIQALYEKFHYGDMDAITKITQQVGVNAEITDKSWDETKEMITNQLEARLKTLDLSDEEYKMILKATITMAYAGEVDLTSVFDQIDAEIARREGDYDFGINANRFKVALGKMDSSVVKTMDELNLLNSTMIGLFDEYDNVEDIEKLFKGPTGEIDKQRAGLLLLDKAYSDLEKEQKEHQLEGENGLYAQRDSLEKEIEEKKKEVDSLKNNVGQLQTQAAGEVGYGPINEKLDYEAKPQLQEAQKELEELEKKWEEINTETEKSENAVKDYQTVIDELVSSFESAQAPSFTELAEDIRGIADELKSIQDLAKALDDQAGKMSLDNIADMFDILGSYENEAMTNAQTWDLWNDSIEKINAGLSVQNGELIAQASVIEGLNNLSQVSAKMKMQEIEATIEQNQLELQLQNAALETQAAAIRAAIEKLKAGKSTAEAEKTIDDEMAQLDANLNAVKTSNAKDSFNQILSYTSHFAKQYSKIMAAAYTGNYDGQYESIDGSFEKILNSFKKDLSTELKKDIVDGDATTSISNLEARLKQINGQISQNNKAINNTLELKKKISGYLASDNTNLAGQIDKTTESQEDYNEKLERTLTLLEKIEGLQHKIDENETFKDLYNGYSGEDYGRLLMSNLGLAQQQYDVYKDLFDMQQEMTNQAAGDLLDSPYGQMFKIQENGDIGWADLTMYDKYKNLPNDMKEDIDNLVEAFQKQRDALRDTENDLTKYAQEVKKVREELVQMQIEIENELVNAIKNREKILHDARVKALDDEINMIEKAVEARKKAQEDDNSNKELYKAQEALRRATLDSSGKNNAQLLQLQQDLEDKQLEIAEKRFEDDMDDRKQWLQDTKDAETETYDYRLEKMTWYWEQVQAIQEEGTETMMETLIHWNEEYRQQSALQQSEMEREWKETMDAMKAASDMGAELDKLTSDIVSVTQTVEAMDIKIQALPGSWQKATDAANAYANAASRASSYSYGGSGAEFNNGGGTPDNNSEQKIPKFVSSFGVGDIVSVKDGNWSLTSKYNLKNGKMKGAGSTAGWNLDNVKVKEIYFDEKAKQFYYKFDKFGDWWYKGLQFNLTKSNGGQKKEIYRDGGIVDYTGPAWVDGNKTHPEAFLSAYQTEQIGALAKSLDPSTVNNATTNSNVTFGSINFNVASMSSAADGKKALDVFVQGANDMMAKKGIGTKLNINMK